MSSTRGRKERVHPHSDEAASGPDNSSLETLTEEMIAEFEQAFRLFDTDGGGTISIRELGAVFESLGQKPTEEDLAEVMLEVDKDGSGAIDLTEFCGLMGTCCPHTKRAQPSRELSF